MMKYAFINSMITIILEENTLSATSSNRMHLPDTGAATALLSQIHYTVFISNVQYKN